MQRSKFKSQTPQLLPVEILIIIIFDETKTYVCHHYIPSLSNSQVSSVNKIALTILVVVNLKKNAKTDLLCTARDLVVDAEV